MQFLQVVIPFLDHRNKRTEKHQRFLFLTLRVRLSEFQKQYFQWLCLRQSQSDIVVFVWQLFDFLFQNEDVLRHPFLVQVAGMNLLVEACVVDSELVYFMLKWLHQLRVLILHITWALALTPGNWVFLSFGWLFDLGFGSILHFLDLLEEFDHFDLVLFILFVFFLQKDWEFVRKFLLLIEERFNFLLEHYDLLLVAVGLVLEWLESRMSG